MGIAQQSGGFLTLLKKRHFLYLWLAQLISMTVLNASNYALLFLIEDVTDSATMIGLAVISFSLPAILIGAPAGVVVDHIDKRRVLWVSNCLRAIATLLFVVVLIFDRGALFPIYLLTFIISAIGQFFAPAEGAAIPRLVDDAELMPALSLFNITFMFSQALGYIILAPILINLLPTITIAHVALDSIVQLHVLIALLYCVCALLIICIPTQRLAHLKKGNDAEIGPLAVKAAGAFQTMWQQMQEGWSFIRHKQALFLAVVQLSFAGVFILVIGQIVLPIVTKLLLLDAGVMALIFAPAGVGLVIGSLVTPHFVQRWGQKRSILLGCLALALAIFALPLGTLLAQFLQPQGWNSNSLLFIFVGFVMFSAGVALDFVNIPAQTAMQELSPDWIKGRVLSLQLVLYNACSIPIILFIGAFIDLFRIDRLLYLLAFSTLVFGLWGVYYQQRLIERNTATGLQEESVPKPTEELVSSSAQRVEK